MSIILPRRELLKGLFAAPALIAATSLMPIKPAASGIFKLESFSEIPSFDSWNLVREKGGNYAWMKTSDLNSFLNPLEILKEVRLTQAESIREIDTTLKLMKLQSATVIHELPFTYRK